MNSKLVKSALAEIRKEFNKEEEKIAVRMHSNCCTSCTIAELQCDGFKRWLVVKHYTSGMNKDWPMEKLDELVIGWNLTSEQLKLSCDILKKYFDVEEPENENKCIIIRKKEE